MSIRAKALNLHKDKQGKLEVVSKVPVRDAADLSLAYTPGVAGPCKEIHQNPDTIYDYTSKGNLVAVVTNGTAVLGLGDIGAGAGMPVMEGKAVLFKTFAGVDAFPICLDTKDAGEIVNAVKLMAPTFGGVNLEDISAPTCFEVEEKLKKEVDIPIFHDDQHGTAIVTCAAFINALKVVGKTTERVKIVINGAGAAGIAVAKLLLKLGVRNIILCDSKGAIYEGRKEGMNQHKEDIAAITNRDKTKGDLGEAIRGADVFVGVSKAGVLSKDMVRDMAKDPVIFAMANPVPEIMPDEATEAGVKVMATGRSDFPNQINNVLAFPGIFRGALDVRARDINEEMKLAAAYAISGLISPEELSADYIIPGAFDPRVAPAVAGAVAKAAMESGIARLSVNINDVMKKTEKLVNAVRKAWA